MIQFLVHGKDDTVGVVVRDIKAGQELSGWNMETDETLSLKANCDIPLGHKMALTDKSSGQSVIKYGHPIGKSTQDIKSGDHVHTHNLKSARW